MEEETEIYNRRLQVFHVKSVREYKKFRNHMYISCISHVRNNLPMPPSIFIEKHTTIHKVICHFINCNIDSRINVDIKSVHPNYSINIHILTVGSYCITNETE